MNPKNISSWDDFLSAYHLTSLIVVMKFECVNITPLLVPVVPEEYNIAAVSDCLTLISGNSRGSQHWINSSVDNESSFD